MKISGSTTGEVYSSPDKEGKSSCALLWKDDNQDRPNRGQHFRANIEWLTERYDVRKWEDRRQ